MIKKTILITLGMFLQAQTVFAQTPVVNPNIHALPWSAGHLIKILLVFMAILGFIVLTAYCMKKFNMVSWTQGPIKLLTGISLSTKERIILIDVGGQQLLLGVSPAGIEKLHAFEEPVFFSEDKQKKKGLFNTILQKKMVENQK